LGQGLLVILGLIVTTPGSSVLALDTTSTATAEWGVEGELNVWLRLDSHHEGWHGHNLAADTDVTLADEHTSVVDGLGKTTLEDEGLEATLHEVLKVEGEHIIQTLLVLVEDSITDHTAHEGLTLEDTLWVLLVLGEEHTSGGTDLGESQTHTPDLTLVLQAKLTKELELGIQTLLVIRAAWSLAHFVEITQLATTHVLYYHL